jgi:hypothetical protein
MGEDISSPDSDEKAVSQAVARILQAASLLCTAADLSCDGDVVSHYINTAIRLRDLANFLSPGKPDWPTGPCEIYDFRTKQKVN